MKKQKSPSSQKRFTSARQIKKRQYSFQGAHGAFKKSGFTIKKVLFQNEDPDEANTLETLETAWKNLPSDFSYEERVIFLEIAEKIVKVHHFIKDFLNDDFKRMKN